ncbi:hypothetical protein HDU98_005821 [Podochytrium sp. JEL0797]|nr:hypothetical protein HDU98_005821 [Podochytrium sp. JEL0797]
MQDDAGQSPPSNKFTGGERITLLKRRIKLLDTPLTTTSHPPQLLHLTKGPKPGFPDARIVPSYLCVPALGPAAIAWEKRMRVESAGVPGTLWGEYSRRVVKREAKEAGVLRKVGEMDQVREVGMNLGSASGEGGGNGNGKGKKGGMLVPMAFD